MQRHNSFVTLDLCFYYDCRHCEGSTEVGEDKEGTATGGFARDFVPNTQLLRNVRNAG